LPQRAVRLYIGLGDVVDKLQPVFALALRLYIFRVFFVSALTKIRSWDSTLALFANEYHVPILPPDIAAVLGTAAELSLPLLLLLGLGTRVTAIALFAFNIVAASSYPDLSDAGVKDHILWGVLLLVTFFYGPGKLALDHWLEKRSGA
jgi:putative oxidoreductase